MKGVYSFTNSMPMMVMVGLEAGEQRLLYVSSFIRLLRYSSLHDYFWTLCRPMPVAMKNHRWKFDDTVKKKTNKVQLDRFAKLNTK